MRYESHDDDEGRFAAGFAGVRVGRGLSRAARSARASSCCSGSRAGDGEDDAARLAGKVARLRVFENDEGRFDRSLLDTGGAALVVSQFTLIADTAKGNRPSFTDAAAAGAGRAALRALLRRAARARRSGRDGCLRRADGGRARQRRPGDDRARAEQAARVLGAGPLGAAA